MGNSNSSQKNTVLPYNDVKAYTPNINFSLDSIQTSQPNVSTVPAPMTGGNNSRVSIVPQRRRYAIDSEQPKSGGKYVSAKQDTHLNSDEYKYIKNMVYSDLVNNNQNGGDGSLYSETTQDGGTVYSATSYTQNGGGSVYSDTTQTGGTVYSATSNTQNGGGCGCASASENTVEYSATSNTQEGGNVYSATSATNPEPKHNNPDSYSVGGSAIMSETSLFNTEKDIAEVQQYIDTLKAQNGGNDNNDNTVYSATSRNLDFDGIMTGGQEPSSTSSSTSSSSSSSSGSSSDDSSSSSSTNETETSKKKLPKQQTRTSNLTSSTQTSSAPTSSYLSSNTQTSSTQMSSAQNNKSTNGVKYSSSDIFSSLSGGSEYLNTMRNRDRMH